MGEFLPFILLKNWASSFVDVVNPGAVDIDEAAGEWKQLRREPGRPEIVIGSERA